MESSFETKTSQLHHCTLQLTEKKSRSGGEKSLASKMMDSEEESDFGGFDSSADEDYVPGEDFSGDDEIEEKPKAKKTKSPPKKRQTRTRRSRRGMRFQRDEESEESDEDEEEEEFEEPEYEDENEEESKGEEEEDGESDHEEKQRIDNIWESMKSDSKSDANSKKDKDKDIAKEVAVEDTKEKDDSAQKEDSEKEDSEKEDSKKKEDCLDTQKDEAGSEETKTVEKISTNEDKTEKADADVKAAPSVSSGSRKRPGGLSGVLGAIGKKTKLSTLAKSKKDWEMFKKDEGIVDELRTSSKDGYLGKQEFLQRVDVRTWENERELRLATGRGKK